MLPLTPMKTLQSSTRIRDLMSIFVTQVEASAAMSLTDINKVAETALIPLFREVYELPNLKNLNSEMTNFPAVDLGDEEARIAIQVTSTSDIDKVKKTLKKFIEHNLQQKFDRVIVYILTKKQDSYSASAIEKVVQGRIDFDSAKDIHDFRDVLSISSNWQLNRLQRVESILEANFGSGNSLALHEVQNTKTETLYLNLLEVTFPDKLYVANLKDELKKSTKNTENGWQRRGKFSRFPKKRSPGPRDLIREFLDAEGLKFSVDWQYQAGQIITFHDLEDPDLPLARVIEPETITILDPEEFYNESNAQENAFRSLLNACIRQKLYLRGVRWQHEQGLFIFGPEDGEDVRSEHWVGKNKTDREVYKVIKKDPTKAKKKNTSPSTNQVFYHKHLAFEAQSLRIADKWYFLIKPDWFCSFDGYKTSFYNADNVSWLKRNETNQSVFNHLRFITYFLNYKEPATLFQKAYVYPFLSFGQLQTLTGAPALDDRDWLPTEGKSKRKVLNDADAGVSDLFDQTSVNDLDDEDEE